MRIIIKAKSINSILNKKNILSIPDIPDLNIHIN